MWAISLLSIVLVFPLISAAPLDIGGGVKDDDGMHSHDENVTRAGKFFGHNQFDVGNINVPGSVAGDDVSIGHRVKIDVHGHTHDRYHYEDDSVIECKEGLLEMFKSIDSNKDGLMDAEELLRVCHQNNIPITESLAVRILTLPDKTVGFNMAKFCELLKDCPSNNSTGLIHFLLQLFDKGTIEEQHEISPQRPQPKDTIEEHEISPPRPQPKDTIEEQHESSLRPQQKGCEVHVGKSTSNTISATVSEGCVCPTVVNKGNWIGDYTYSDEFTVTQDGSSLQLQRTDSDHGWGMDLSFKCNLGPCLTESVWDCCSSTSPCKEKEGDCNNDSECAGSLVCGTDNNCKGINPLAHPDADCCIPVCTPDAVNSDACFCKSSTGGESCMAGQRCKKHGTCQSVITKCGIENPVYEISGGSGTRKNQYPWMVWLPMGCGGSLITDIHILTARHCLKVPGNWIGKKVKVGVHNRYEPKDYQEVFIKNYDWPTINNHDIAIIILDTPVNLNDKKIGTVCLPSSATKDYRGQRGTAMGWGMTQQGSPESPFLQHVELTVSQKEDPNYLYTEVSVVDDVPQDPCRGDSGGPLIHRDVRSGRWTIIGTVVGDGYDCDTDSFKGEGKYGKGMWNKITDHLDWIHRVIGNKG